MVLSDVKKLGASKEAIQHHYDVGNEFYRLWLDSTMTYTCAFWNENDSLETAQLRKIDFHAQQIKCPTIKRVLDIGCSWGSTLKRLVEEHQVEQAIGLTLSSAQIQWISQFNNPQIKVLQESWTEHSPEKLYDGIISIEALEAFTKFGLSSQEKIFIYRTFFSKCHEWLVPGAWMSIQTAAYGNSGVENFDEFIKNEIFPESDLPRLAEVVEAAEDFFEIVILRNERYHYAQTLKKWRSRLRANRNQAIELVGEKKVINYERYLQLTAYMVETGACNLYQITFRRIDQPYKKNK